MARSRSLIGLGLICLACSALSPLVHADDSPATRPADGAADPLAEARARIAQRDWAAAIRELQALKATESADWNNLMGYSHRKLASPDLAAAQRYYDAALRLDPKHRGALEYSGELYLMLGQPALAEQRLATLDKLCFLPCEEYTDLKNAIARYKAGGRR